MTRASSVSITAAASALPIRGNPRPAAPSGRQHPNTRIPQSGQQTIIQYSLFIVDYSPHSGIFVLTTTIYSVLRQIHAVFGAGPSIHRENGLFTRRNESFTKENESSTRKNESFTTENESFTNENRTFTRENESFTRKNGAFTRENETFTTGNTAFPGAKRHITGFP
jgi:hypothetical protein